MARARVVAVLLCGASLLTASAARAQETVAITQAGFSPDALGMPTNAFGSATIGSTTGPVPSPIRHVNVYGPAGVTLDLEEKYTLDFFLADNRPGHVRLLIFLSGNTPVSVEMVFGATVIQGPKPYGLGFSVDVPEIKVLPEASNASAKTAFLTLGAHNVAYYRTVHGKRRLFHVKGIILPKSCPRGGWPVASQFTFEDGSTVMATRKIHCPGR
jgi:hypothetical protein